MTTVFSHVIRSSSRSSDKHPNKAVTQLCVIIATLKPNYCIINYEGGTRTLQSSEENRHDGITTQLCI